MRLIIALSLLFLVLYAVLKSLVIVTPRSRALMFRSGKFHRAYGPGLHIVPQAVILKRVDIHEGMRVGIVSGREIEVGTHKIRASFLEQPAIGASGIVTGFSGGIPRISQNQPELPSHETVQERPKPIAFTDRLLMLALGTFPLIEGYNALTQGHTFIAGKLGRHSTRIDGGGAIVLGVIFILIGIWIYAAALGLIKKRKVR